MPTIEQVSHGDGGLSRHACIGLFAFYYNEEFKSQHEHELKTIVVKAILGLCQCAFF